MHHQRNLPFTILAIAVLHGCVSQHDVDPWIDRRPLGMDLPAYQAPKAPPHKDKVGPSIEEPTSVLTLRRALAAALAHNPELAAFSWEVRVRDARALQTGLLPNPEVGFEVDEVGDTGATSGFDGAEMTVLLSQLIPLGAKIEKQTRVAELDRDLAGWDYESKRIEIFTTVTAHFVDVAVAQRRLELARENVALAEQVFEAATKRMKAGAATTIDQTKAQVVVATAQIDLQRIQWELASARHGLAATWASTAPAFEHVAADLERIESIPCYDNLVTAVSQNAQLARRVVEISQRKAQIELAKAQAIPDVTAGAGVRHLNESDDTVYLMEFSLPIPLFDRNQGGILEARYAAAKAAQEHQAAEVQVRTFLVQAYQALATAYDEVRSLKNHVVPAARQAFDLTNKAYQEGKTNYLEVLDAQRTLIEIEVRYVSALGGYHAAVSEIEGLIGQTLNALTVDQTAEQDSSAKGDTQ